MNNLSEKRRFLQFLTWGFLITLFLLSSPHSLPAQDTSPDVDTVTNPERKPPEFSLFGMVNGGLGKYDNLMIQNGNSESFKVDGSDAALLHWEIGLRVRLLGITYFWESVRCQSSDDQNNILEANRTRQGIRAFSYLSRGRIHFLPEAAYLLLHENARIYDQHRGKPDLHNQECNVSALSYGLSTRFRLILIGEAGLWLYGRYVHDNLDIRADNYWAELHLMGVGPKPAFQSVYFSLGARWTKRSDGRSESFLTLSWCATFGAY